MSADIIGPSPVVAEEDEDPAVVIAWLDGPEGVEWSRSRHQTASHQGQDTSALSWKQAPGDLAEDPCGRPPGAGVENAATRETG